LCALYSWPIYFEKGKTKKKSFLEIFCSIKFSDRTESALPASTTRAATALPVIRSSKKSGDPAFTPWDLSRIWIQSIEKEETTRKQWEQMYGWMAELDAKVLIRSINKIKEIFHSKGNPKSRQRTLIYSSRFSTKVCILLLIISFLNVY
jgi:hypothetical protein